MIRPTTRFALAVMLSPALALASPADDASLSWQLRPVTIEDGARIDGTAAAFTDHNGNLDLAVATTFTATYRLSDAWAPVVRLGLVGNDAPGAALDGSSFGNPLVGVAGARAAGDYRFAVFGGATIPVGTGNARTHTASMTARPADAVLFDVDDMAGIAGVDVAYVKGGFTAQAEATLVAAVRLHGDERSADAWSTRGSLGLHLAYVIGRHVAIGGDLHRADTLTASVGVRAQFELGAQAWIRPGIAVLRGLDRRGLDAPMVTAQTTAVMLDLPVTF